MKKIIAKRKKLCFLFILSIFFFPINSFGQSVFENSIMNGGNFEEAAFRLYFNNDIKTIRGIIVLVPGSNRDGRNMVNDTVWQNLALRHDFALLGCYFKDRFHENMAIEEYVAAERGSGQALVNSLQVFSKASQHSELEFAPLALWGMSAGGEFNYEFTCWNPERVIGFVVNKGGVYYSSLASKAAWEVPGVFFTGSKDSPYRSNIVKGIFSINRRFGAKWMFIKEIGVSHEFGKSKEFVKFFFDNIIPLRVSADKINSSYTLKKMTSTGYIGVSSTQQILPDIDYKQSEITSWFSNQQIAEKWLEFIK
jgi:dienelactone hydrolase